jgi:hypothetical protein
MRRGEPAMHHVVRSLTVVLCGLALSSAVVQAQTPTPAKKPAPIPAVPPAPGSAGASGAGGAGGAAAADAPKVKVERGAGGRKVYRITDEIRIEGKIQKPEAFFFYQKSSINYDWQELKQDVIPKILDSVSRAPF